MSFDNDTARRPNFEIPSSTDLKLDLLANQLKINVPDNDSPTASVVEVVDDGIASERQDTFADIPQTVKQPSPPSPSHTPSVKVQNPAMSEKNARYRKVELLRIFQELEQRGVRISSLYSMSSNLEDMEQEYEILKSVENKKQAVKLYKGFMINGIQALEFLNETYNPFDFHLKGWSEHIGSSADDYNDVLGELYEKYKNTGRKIEPELKLVIMLMMSATTFHATQTFMKTASMFSNSIPKADSRPKNAPPPASTMKGPDPREFLDKLRKEKNTQPPLKRPPVVVDDSSSDVSSTTVTTTTARRNKKPPMMINL